MSHGIETQTLTRRAMASLSGQNWSDDPIDESTVEMTVMFMVALAARDDEGFRRAVEAFKVPA